MEGLGSFLLFAAFIYLMMRFGCGSHLMRRRGGHSRSGGNTVNNTDQIEKYVDPVCDMEVETEQGYGKMYKGTLYRFCSRSCLDKFDTEPEHYLHSDVMKPVDDQHET
ncbi:MAG: YHS domain-containing protein [Gammaproteobacteria bacterium]|nr:YHS domain-containing protein [Gammaproteobacteria bacterium]